MLEILGAETLLYTEDGHLQTSTDLLRTQRKWLNIT